MADDGQDDRFREFKTNPKFRKVKRSNATKVEIDSRFKGILNKGEGFNLEWKRDRRGRTVNLTQEENFNRFYKTKDQKSKILDDEESEEDDRQTEYDRIRGIGGTAVSSDSESDSDDEVIDDNAKDIYDENDESSDDDGILRTEIVSRRLAVQNMDWDRINAADVYVLLNSYTPKDGKLESVTIYPSQFGKERLKFEEKHGPTLANENSKLDDEEKLRLYQLERLKYYYAVAIADKPETLDDIYREVEGQSYGESGVLVDLRFIPDEVSFEEDVPRLTKTRRQPDVCKMMPKNYEAPEFVTSALTRSKVSLTWDETDSRRRTLLRKGDFEEDQVKHLLASGSETDEDENPEEAEKLAKQWRQKFASILDETEKDKKSDSEEEKSDSDNDDTDGDSDDNINKNVEFKIENNQDSDSDSDNLLSDDEPVVPKKKKRVAAEVNSEDEREKAELDLVMFDPEDNHQKHFDLREEKQESKLKKRKFKKNAKKELSEGADLTDSRFSNRLLAEDEFAIDRTNPNYKPSKAMDELHKKKNSKVASKTKPKEKELEEIIVSSSKKPVDESNDIIRRLKMRANK